MTVPSRTILFADDDVLTQWIMSDVLSQAGFSVVSACRSDQARALLDGSNEFDLLLADLHLPDSITGHELGDHWRAVCPGRPVIYTGPNTDSQDRGLEQSEYFIEKPLGADKLLRLIDWALEDASLRPFMPAIARRSHHAH